MSIGFLLLDAVHFAFVQFQLLFSTGQVRLLLGNGSLTFLDDDTQRPFFVFQSRLPRIQLCFATRDLALLVAEPFCQLAGLQLRWIYVSRDVRRSGFVGRRGRRYKSVRAQRQRG